MESINIGIAGLGTVGTEVVKQLKINANFLNKKAGAKLNLTAISARNKGKDRGFDASNLIWIEVAEDLAFEKDVDVVVELIGGADGTALNLCKSALKKGKSIVTANKAMMS